MSSSPDLASLTTSVGSGAGLPAGPVAVGEAEPPAA